MGTAPCRRENPQLSAGNVLARRSKLPPLHACAMPPLPDSESGSSSDDESSSDSEGSVHKHRRKHKKKKRRRHSSDEDSPDGGSGSGGEGGSSEGEEVRCLSCQPPPSTWPGTLLPGSLQGLAGPFCCHHSCCVIHCGDSNPPMPPCLAAEAPQAQEALQTQEASPQRQRLMDVGFQPM